MSGNISTVDSILNEFLLSLQDTALAHHIELMPDALQLARSSFLRACAQGGIPNIPTAKECGKRFVLKMLNP